MFIKLENVLKFSLISMKSKEMSIKPKNVQMIHEIGKNNVPKTLKISEKFGNAKMSIMPTQVWTIGPRSKSGGSNSGTR
jgi:hypothetical protein